MSAVTLPEVWLRGPLPGIPSPLQPVAHALLQAREELHARLAGFPVALLWERPAGVASVGFHLQHLTGVLDRLFTYARGKPLSQAQLAFLSAEGVPDTGLTVTGLLGDFDRQVDAALDQLSRTSEPGLAETRLVGRGKAPSTQLGLLAHAAEHIMRHLGQLLVTAQVLSAG
ncbi:MAG: DinB family protein [Puia sp.]|nr:DinB family protein [Puia sp.]